MELAAVNPEFVFFGRNAATGRSLCARLARLLLRIAKSFTSRTPRSAALKR
jgi:predicted ATPase